MTDSDHAADQAAVGEVLMKLAAAFRGLDADGLDGVYAQDADWTNAFGTTKHGRDDRVLSRAPVRRRAFRRGAARGAAAAVDPVPGRRRRGGQDVHRTRRPAERRRYRAPDSPQPFVEGTRAPGRSLVDRLGEVAWRARGPHAQTAQHTVVSASAR